MIKYTLHHFISSNYNISVNFKAFFYIFNEAN